MNKVFIIRLTLKNFTKCMSKAFQEKCKKENTKKSVTRLSCRILLLVSELTIGHHYPASFLCSHASTRLLPRLNMVETSNKEFDRILTNAPIGAWKYNIIKVC